MPVCSFVLSLLVITPCGAFAEQKETGDFEPSFIEKTDLRIRNFAQARKSKAAERFFITVRPFGDWRLYAGITAAFFAAGENEFGELALKGGAITGVATESIRYVVGRTRPRRDPSPIAYRLGGKSFPSGHTSSAFALATALDETYGVGYATYPLAAMTGLSRIYHDGHWLSDTMMGAGIGIASVKAVALHDKDGKDFDDSSGIYAESFGAFTLADFAASRIANRNGRWLLRGAAIGFSASRIDEELDIYAAFAGIATSLLLSRGLKKFRRLQLTPRSVSLAWEW